MFLTKTQSPSRLRWAFSIFKRLRTISPGPTAATVACLVGARFARMFAFVLPLKVILLAGSEHVPHYFRHILSEEHRELGIFVFSVAAVLSYCLNLTFEAQAKRLTRKGGDQLLAASGVMALVVNQGEQMQGFFARFTHIAAALFFIVVGLTGLLFINRPLAAFLVVAGIGLALFTTWALSGLTELTRTRLSDLITEQLGTYLGILSSLVFFASFLVILYPLLTGERGNILYAVYSLVLLRNMLPAATSSIRGAVTLLEQRTLIDALIFPEHRFEALEAKDQRTLRDLFNRTQRRELAAQHLSRHGGDGTSFQVEWRDPLLRGAADFAVTVMRDGQAVQHLRQIVMPVRHQRLIENETLLFSHVPRSELSAAPLLDTFTHGPYRCLVYDVGTGQGPQGREWLKLRMQLIATLWSVAPPAELVKIYASSHKFLHERLNDALLSRLDIAVDTDEEKAALDKLRTDLGTFRERLASLPLCFINPMLRPDQMVRRLDGGIDLLAWGHWSLEPAGAGLGRVAAREEDLQTLVAAASHRRPEFQPVSEDLAAVMLARDAALLERAIQRGAMKAALLIVAQIVNGLAGGFIDQPPIIEEEDEEDESLALRGELQEAF